MPDFTLTLEELEHHKCSKLAQNYEMMGFNAAFQLKALNIYIYKKDVYLFELMTYWQMLQLDTCLCDQWKHYRAASLSSCSWSYFIKPDSTAFSPKCSVAPASPHKPTTCLLHRARVQQHQTHGPLIPSARIIQPLSDCSPSPQQQPDTHRAQAFARVKPPFEPRFDKREEKL